MKMLSVAFTPILSVELNLIGLLKSLLAIVSTRYEKSQPSIDGCVTKLDY